MIVKEAEAILPQKVAELQGKTIKHRTENLQLRIHYVYITSIKYQEYVIAVLLMNLHDTSWFIGRRQWLTVDELQQEFIIE